MPRTYIAIDLKSFYASVECVDRGLDPLKTNLVVADASRTDKTICLAVSPSLKAYGIGGRARLFEVVQRVREVNRQRSQAAGGPLTAKSTHDPDLQAHPDWALDYIVAPPQMRHYMEVSAEVYKTYLKYIRPEEIHAYSVDEVFIDATDYLGTYRMTAHELATTMVRDVLRTTGITATAGIGTNLYLCKVAMDIVAKHLPPDADGVRIAELDEMEYRRRLWDYRPITKFWRVGHGIAARLAPYGIDTMGKLARASLTHQDFLYQLFGVNAELLIDHAWGHEPCTIKLVKSYRPTTHSLSYGQVLTAPFTAAQARTTVREMADSAVLDLVDKQLATTHLSLYVGYDIECLTRPEVASAYKGPMVADHYGRRVPRPAGGSVSLPEPTSSAKAICEAVDALYTRIVNPALLVRRINLAVGRLTAEPDSTRQTAVQLDLFSDPEEQLSQRRDMDKERRLQEARLAIRQRFGKNAILKGTSFEDGATAKQRNQQIGGHKA